MNFQFAQSTSHIGFLLVGIAIGGMTVWLIFRNRLQTERTKLNDQVSTLSGNLANAHEKLELSEQTAADYRDRLGTSQIACAQLNERAGRVTSLEDQIASLQSSLREETNQKAMLTETSKRLPDIEGRLDVASRENRELYAQLLELREKLVSFDVSLQRERQTIVELNSKLSEFSSTHRELTDNKTDLTARIVGLTTELNAERASYADKLATLENAEGRLVNTFKTLASEMLEDKSSRFTEQNKSNIGQILDPLNIKIQEFQTKVDRVYEQDSNDRAALKEQVRQLMSLSERVSDDAKNLANALKGSSKTQGNWGEMILERVLEVSGLRKGYEYELRETFHYQDGTRGQPDVVIRLPENRQLVVDAKVSLTDYDRYANAQNDVEREEHLESHVVSVRRHIKELSEKNYHTLYELTSLDLVVMFIPLEPAFSAAITQDNKLWDEGLRRNVLIVSPSSLLFVLRTVAYLWRQDAQAKNVQEIARCGADLYDKFVGFIADMKGLGHQLHKAEGCYEEAFKKLHTGKGNLVNRADKLKELGIVPKKSLSSDLVDASQDSSFVFPEIAAASDQELIDSQGTK
jgi:DNA recombination protein RmuC